jgi:hypothetical protein
MSLQDELIDLAELDKQLIRAFMENDAGSLPEVIGKYLDARQRLREELVDETVVSVADDRASGVLRKVISGTGLPSDKLIRRLLGADWTPDAAIDEAVIDELGAELFYSWFSHSEYVAGLAELRPMVIRSDASPPVQNIVKQIKRCYAFQQYDAVIVLCRALIEVCIRDICARKNLFPTISADVVLLEQYRWSDLRRKVSSGALEGRLRNLYHGLSIVVHGRRPVPVIQEEARKRFEEALELIEDLYAAHDL